ncbi:LON peptidase substrate-binding domain-containing protein [Actinomadura alba]|uniref:LON peptidase substrate-binding domain-containing protein n=1 Tax=Actinomadura alba TaxID=406431 RepID=A0ABR7LLD4_9ACTN|nr:LON peptidase substrate-binding domain-containing protein [Actinomadura alba]
MTEQLPLFPLGTVLFPGLMLPLHLFEERYRLLLRDLLDRPEPRRFGIVAIEFGHEVGAGAARRLAGVGCVAELHGVTALEDGRFDIVTVGGRRFRRGAVDDTLPYLRAEAELLPDEAGPNPEPHAGLVKRLFTLYRRRLAATGAEIPEPIDLPADPVKLSYLVAAAVVLDLGDKQRLLEAENATTRLRLEAKLLLRENRLIGAVPAVPASQFIDGGVHLN